MNKNAQQLEQNNTSNEKLLHIFGYVIHCRVYSMNQASGISFLFTTW